MFPTTAVALCGSPTCSIPKGLSAASLLSSSIHTFTAPSEVTPAAISGDPTHAHVPAAYSRVLHRVTFEYNQYPTFLVFRVLREHISPSLLVMQVTGFRSGSWQEVGYPNVTQCNTLDSSTNKCFVSLPVSVFDYTCLDGLKLSAVALIRGRGTMVSWVVNPRVNLNKRPVALKAACQNLTQVHPHDVQAVSTHTLLRNGEACKTLDTAKRFLEDEFEASEAKNHVSTISISELKRPVTYFWGVHDFVRGLRGALLGHQYLTNAGILHGDISENNIAFGRRPEDERGYLIDFDVAILQEAEKPASSKPPNPSWNSPPEEQVESDKKHLETPKTYEYQAMFPYVSYNILWGGKHTHSDDVESFLYVLLLFFFSYAGPLSVSELREADEAGFIPRRPSNARNWPKEYAEWTDGHAWQVGSKKYYCVWNADDGRSITRSPEFLARLEDNWPEELHRPIAHLVEQSFKIFQMSATSSGTDVSHVVFIKVLDEWLDKYVHLEDKFSNCPFVL